ncbi:MAG: hypothetical protein GY862_12565 [Gammaproteobacteria bacterium]|nr:hypothetical protein [Gammaproteobacteria bacterium]
MKSMTQKKSVRIQTNAKLQPDAKKTAASAKQARGLSTCTGVRAGSYGMGGRGGR